MVKKPDDMLSRFHPILGRYGRTDGRTDRIAISISRVSVLTRDKKLMKYTSIFYKLRGKLPGHMLREIYCAFIHSHVLYGVEIYAYLPK